MYNPRQIWNAGSLSTTSMKNTEGRQLGNTIDVEAELGAFLKTYGEPSRPQQANCADVDSELKHISLPLSQILSATNAGTIIDLGCGTGIILKRLAELQAFMESEWLYVCIDFEERVNDVLKLAVDLRLNRRAEGTSIKDFYARPFEIRSVTRPFLVVIRNVLHELDIPRTVELLHACVKGLQAGDKIVIQDLQVFPEAERGNVCWNPTVLQRALRRCGFTSTPVAEVSGRGNRWFSLIADKTTTSTLTAADIFNIVVEERKSQLDLWTTLGELAPKDKAYRHNKIAMLDFDLQRAALLEQLNIVNAPGIQRPSAEQQALTAKLAFAKQLESFRLADLQRTTSFLPRVPHFRDRARDQDDIELFLRSNSSVLVARGGPYMGKSVLVNEVLARRAHDRQVLIIDPQLTSNVWNIVEQFLVGIGCKISYAVIASFRGAQLVHVMESLAKLTTWVAKHTIIVIDHFERLLDPDSRIVDPEICAFLGLLTSNPQSKVIVTTQREPSASTFESGVIVFPTVITVGRFPEGKHVENVLDDFVDRKRLGIEQYPDELLSAIDRYPYLAVLAAKIVQKEGQSALADQALLSNIREKLRDDLLRRLVTNDSRSAIEYLSLIRIPVPRKMFEGLAGKKSVNAAEQSGLMYPIFDRYGRDLLTGADLLRADPEDDEINVPTDDAVGDRLRQKQHAIADWYERLYRENDDPRWLRELYYHRLLTGDEQQISRFGVAYRTELFLAGDYWFRRLKDFRLALKAFQAAEKLGLKSYLSEMRLAACLIRVNKRSEGEMRYMDIIQRYPKSSGVKMSLVDSLLFVHAYQSALDKLAEFNFKINDDPWITGEFGRAYFGLHRYTEAASAFETQIRVEPNQIVFWMLARTYHRSGQRDDVARVLEKGLKRYPNNRHLLLSKAAHLISLGGAENWIEAEQLLRELLAIYQHDGAILQQLCKLLCLKGNAGDAQSLFIQHRSKLHPERYKVPIEVDICIARKNWNGALNLLTETDINDEHIIGLKRKVYLQWARSETNPIQQMRIARQGLDGSVGPGLENNVPLMVTSVKLAKLAQDLQLYQSALAKLERQNAPVAASIVASEDVHTPTYWEEDSFEPLSAAEVENELPDKE